MRQHGVMDALALRDLAEFARLELEAGDIEPWAAVIGAANLDRETALWALKLYNAYDDLGSAWRVMDVWPGPAAWAADTDHTFAAQQPIPHERRNLCGGKVTLHLDSYVNALAGQSQWSWLMEGIPTGADPYEGFTCLMPYLRRVWGVGRQTAFEWAEFVAKIAGLPVETTDGCLWESSGPRESIERLYGSDLPSSRVYRPHERWLNHMAHQCRTMLADEGAPLSWWDFETVICDFNVMRKGRYYPGKHIAMIREEIEGLDDPHHRGVGGGRARLRAAFAKVVPEPWASIPPGADKAMAQAYRDTGRIHTPISLEAN